MKKQPTVQNKLFGELAAIIQQNKQQVAIQINSALVNIYWQVGERINTALLKKNSASQRKTFVEALAQKLSQQFGNGFKEKNLRRMMQFAKIFPNYEKVVTLSRQLSWSHFLALIPIKSKEARAFYIKKIAEEQWSVCHTRHQMERKVFERSSIADSQLPIVVNDQHALFKDPYFLDFLGLKEGYLEADLEGAILKELELFILELGMGFTFVERQKRMIIDNEDYYLDLLFYHRKLRRLVAIELKIGKFKAAYKGQMELYLKWLDKYDKQIGEEAPIGLILCAETSHEQVELLEMHKDGIMVAEYWTVLPPKKVLEEKLHQALVEARERMARKQINSLNT